MAVRSAQGQNMAVRSTQGWRVCHPREYQPIIQKRMLNNAIVTLITDND